MYRIATVFELASVCPPPQGLSGAPIFRKQPVRKEWWRADAALGVNGAG